MDAAAIGLMIAANIMFAFNDVWLRRIADDIGLVQTIWGRSVLFLCIMLPAMSWADWKAAVTTSKPYLQIIYTQLFGTVAAGWLFYSQVPQLYTALGAGLIALGGCIVLLRRPRSLSDSAPTNS